MRNLFKKKQPEKEQPKTATRNYSMAQVSRLTGDFFSGSRTADQSIYQSISTMRNRARELERSDARVRKFLIMAKTSVVGAKGIRLQSRAGDQIKGRFIPAKQDQYLIEQAYQDFSKPSNFSLNQRIGRRQFAQMGFQRLLVDGECIVQKVKGADNPHGIAYQMIDAERLDHSYNRRPTDGANEIRMGVEIDSVGRRIAYHFLEEPQLNQSGYGLKRKPVPADQIIHIYINERPNQTRGVTWLAPTGLRAHLLDGIETAVSVGFKVAASKMGFLTPGADYEGEDLEVEDIPADVSPGALDLLPKGVSFESFDPGYPDADFDGFKKSIIREIAGGLGVSYPELGNDFQGVSYSAGQIGVHSDIALWSDLQQVWIESFEEPVYLDWLPMAITAGALRLPITKRWKFENIKFQPPRRKHIDPLKTHNAQRIALGDMTRDPFEIAAENGEDLEDVMDGFQRAREMAKDRGLPIPESWANGNELTQVVDGSDDGSGDLNGIDKWI